MVDIDADVCDADDSSAEVKGPVKETPEVGSGDDSDVVVSPPARVSPKGCRTSRSLRK